MRWPTFLLSVVFWLVLMPAITAQSERGRDPTHRSGMVAADAGDAMSTDVADEFAVGGPDEQLGRLFDRYLWFVPQAPGHKASFGIGVFVAFALLIMFSARFANLDGVTFGRACAMSGILLLLGCIEGVFVPALALAGLSVALLDVAVWFLLVRFLLGGDFWNAAVMLVSFVFVVLLAVLGLEIGYTLLHRDELMH